MDLDLELAWTQKVNDWMDKNRHKRTEKYWVRKFRDYMNGDDMITSPNEAFLQGYLDYLSAYPSILTDEAEIEEAKRDGTQYFISDAGTFWVFKSFRVVLPDFLKTTGGEPTSYSGSRLCTCCGEVQCDARLERQSRMRAKLDTIRLKRLEEEEKRKKQQEKSKRNQKKRIRNKRRDQEKKEDKFINEFRERLNSYVVPEKRIVIHPDAMKNFVLR